MSTADKLLKLKNEIKSLGGLAVAFSGGVDSTFLLAAAKDVLGDRTIAITARIPSMPAPEAEEAAEFCKKNGIRQSVIHVDTLEVPEFRFNAEDRCYHCKKAIFAGIITAAGSEGISRVAEGSNADDRNDYRPGMKAIRELGVLSPLEDAGLTKTEIREISKEMGLPTWDKPASPCLATRFQVGAELTLEKLEMVGEAESFIRELIPGQVRVRVYGDKAVIETEKDRISEITNEDAFNAVDKRLKAIGFTSVTVDPEGYRMGNMNKKERE